MIETYHNDRVIQLTRHDTVKQASNWIDRNKSKYEQELQIGTNTKDGYVVFYDREFVVCDSCRQETPKSETKHVQEQGETFCALCYIEWVHKDE